MNVSFKQAIMDAGMTPPDHIRAGYWERFPGLEKKTSNRAGFCFLFDDLRGGVFGDFSRGLNEVWHLGEEMSLAEQATARKQIKEAQKRYKKELYQAHKKAAKIANDRWNKAASIISHSYLTKKKVLPLGIKQEGKDLIIPIYVNDVIVSIQTITPEGEKRFQKHGQIAAGYYPIGKPKKTLYICEGYATGATLHQATDKAVAVAFNSGNLKPVAEALHSKYPDLEIVIVADNDRYNGNNPGATKAKEAAIAVNGRVIIPEFVNTESKPTDFNDLARLEGMEQVKKFIDKVQNTEETKEDTQQESVDELKNVILDHGVDLISRPIALIKEKGYIATWVDMKQGKETMRDVLCILNQDGEIFTTEDAPGNDIKDLNIPVDLPMVIENKKRLSGKGLKKYLDNEKPDPVKVFERLRDYFDHFMDFDLSFSPQAQMSELSACYAISTYLTDAFPVIGYLWPNGETGSGKTHYLITMAEVAYMGQVILAGGTFSSLRDLASYGATLCFDDAEKIMDNKIDPDKQTLLLAGNRKGTTVTFKEQVKNHKWQNKNVHVYCPRLFSAIRLPSETLINRSIIIPLVASGDNRKSNSDPMDYETWPKDIDRADLVDDLWMMALDNISTIPKHDRLVTSMSQINGRGFQPWRAIHTIAHWLMELGADGLYDRMIKVTEDYRNEGDLIVPDTKVKLITETLRELYTKYGATSEIILTSKEICSELTSLASENDLIDEDDKHYLSPRSLGWKLKHMRLKKPGKRSGAAREWVIDEGTLKRLERPFNLTNQTSQTSQNVKTSQNNDVSPENDVNDVNDVLSEGSKVTDGNGGNEDIPHVQVTL